MPGRHFVIAKNIISNDYKILPWWGETYRPKHETWMSTYYVAGEMRDPQWIQVGIYESEDDAMKALTLILQS